MDNTQLEKSCAQVKRSMRLSAITAIITATAFINIVKHSNIRNVEVLTILACGMAIGAFIVNLVLLFRLNNQKPNGTGF